MEPKLGFWEWYLKGFKAIYKSWGPNILRNFLGAILVSFLFAGVVIVALEYSPWLLLLLPIPAISLAYLMWKA